MVDMVRTWMLVALIAVGWLLPSGARLPLCGCLFAGADAPACCAIADEVPAEPACCASRGVQHAPAAARAGEVPASEAPSDGMPPDGPRDDGPRAGRDDACTCSVSVPAHDDTRATTAPLAHGASAQAPPRTRDLLVLAESDRASTRVDAARPRAPTPGGVVPLPLRL
jgi:hypothetical protein